MKRFFRNIKTGIKNLWKWKSVIWNDRDFDHYYLYTILNFKLKQMYNKFKENDVYVGQGKDAKKIKICCLLLNRINNGFFYTENAYKNHDRKWGEIQIGFEPSERKSGCSRLNITRDNVKTEQDEKQETKEFLKCTEHEDYLKKQDLKYLFKILNKHSRSWWI